MPSYIENSDVCFPRSRSRWQTSSCMWMFKQGRSLDMLFRSVSSSIFLPVLAGLKITDCRDPVWQLVIDLRRPVEVVCAPVVSHELIAQIDCVIEEYLDERVELAMLTVPCRPLIRRWTLRFESKHFYFKACIRSAQNFKNITYTFSHKHHCCRQCILLEVCSGNLSLLIVVFHVTWNHWNGILLKFAMFFSHIHS
jgi:hypothetical protein